jgi:hypothetical protein
MGQDAIVTGRREGKMTRTPFQFNFPFAILIFQVGEK